MDELEHQFTQAALAQDWDTALALSERLLALAPDTLDLRARTAAVYGWRAGHTLPAAPGAADDRALADFTRAIELDPQTADWYFGRGMRYADAGADAEALADFTQAVTLSPQTGAYYYERGQVYRRLGDRAAARRDFAQVVALDHGYTDEAQAALATL
jgi:tetratricopeptide (TPR) repeat protein